ncbi:hypothetical protein [Rhodanobacter sp. BL-MT-08]
MIERVIHHPAGRFTRCRNCGSEPRHIHVLGRSSREPVVFMATGPRHRIECRCGTRTTPHTTVTGAELEWGTDYAQLALPLRVPRRRSVAA